MVRSPVEISCVAVESLFLFHTANASALQTSMLPTVLYSFGWPIDDSGFQIMVVIVVVMGCGGDMGTRPPDMVVVADSENWLFVLQIPSSGANAKSAVGSKAPTRNKVIDSIHIFVSNAISSISGYSIMYESSIKGSRQSSCEDDEWEVGFSGCRGCGVTA
ncbi:hypothetical protein E3N88_32387 [Mikania micrantha]|uniref:Uncharacterized protein n=1 Tax=Mikania micrantha TaxID=192012 RepID=A0A5N6MAZ8_9ASTR|nr:hypothetical protein E3N88_32387 [Mikania micrantha]